MSVGFFYEDETLVYLFECLIKYEYLFHLETLIKIGKQVSNVRKKEYLFQQEKQKEASCTSVSLENLNDYDNVKSMMT